MALINLGFSKCPEVGSRHCKYRYPRAIEAGQRPFVILLNGKKEYDPITCENIVKQIKKFGYDDNQIQEALK